MSLVEQLNIILGFSPRVDALSGATITSTAVTDIVNNSYFYVTEVLCAE